MGNFDRGVLSGLCLSAFALIARTIADPAYDKGDMLHLFESMEGKNNV